MESLTQHNNNSLSNNINREEDNSIYSNSEKEQELVIKNSEKIEKYSKIITISILSILAILTYFFWNLLWFKIVLGILLFFDLVSDIIPFFIITVGCGVNTNEKRIYSKFPAIISIFVFACGLLYLANCTSLFSDGATAKCIVLTCCVYLSVWLIIFSIHSQIVDILQEKVFKNIKHKYTAKIIELSQMHFKSDVLYSAVFYDYNLEKNSLEISKKEFETWKVGDTIEVTLQQKIHKLDALKAVRLDNFEGLTDMEIEQQKHKKEVEMYGQSQHEMDNASGESKKSNHNSIFATIDLFLLITNMILHLRYMNNLLDKNLFDIDINGIVYYIALIIPLAVTIMFSAIEYNNISSKYTREDLLIWIDFLLPRCLFYFLSGYMLIWTIKYIISVIL